MDQNIKCLNPEVHKLYWKKKKHISHPWMMLQNQLFVLKTNKRKKHM